uniref:Uncharacterized protein n=1 Tax=Anguilla anguilla TaxID=7936 RepID=A0A0E9S7M8_ANGAN
MNWMSLTNSDIPFHKNMAGQSNGAKISGC